MAETVRKRRWRDVISNGGIRYGYNPEILCNQSEVARFLCTSCDNLLREPMQNGCGHRFCADCMASYSGRADPCCPLCTEDGERSVVTTHNAHQDKGIRRDMAKVTAKCTNEYCIWTGLFQDYMVHEKTCEFTGSDSEMAPRSSDSDRSDLSANESDEESERRMRVDDVRALPETLRNAPTLLLTVDNYREKLSRAKKGPGRGVYGEPRYTGTPGYNIGACLFLNGDGMAKNRYMSAFVYIARGEYDDRVSWPFRGVIHLSLVNHEGGEEVTETFRPDPTSSSFGRPRAGRNTPTGLPLFCRLSLLQAPTSYVRDDKIVLRVNVCPEDTLTAPEG